MKGQCCICTELFQEDSEISAVQCGHTFHYRCLQQWLDQSKTCPTCRKSVNQKYIVAKLFFDATDDHGKEVDVSSIQNKVADLHAKLRQKDAEQQELNKEYVMQKQKLDDLTVNMRAMEVVYKQEKGNSSALKKELRFHKELQQESHIAIEETKILKTKLADLKNVEKIVKGNEGEIQRIINQGDIKQLSTWCCILQKELHTKRQECKTLREITDKLKRENGSQKRIISEKMDSFIAAQEQVRILKEEIKDADEEVMKLKKKNEALLRAIGSPSDTTRSLAHRLIHESPAPMISPMNKKPRLTDCMSDRSISFDLDTSADLFGDSEPDQSKSEPSPSVQRKKDCQEYGTQYIKITTAASTGGGPKPKSEMTDISNIPGLSNFNLFKKKAGMGLADSSSMISKGYNGFGGHETFIHMRGNDGFKAPAPVKRKNKFGPSTSLSKKPPPLPRLEGFLSQD